MTTKPNCPAYHKPAIAPLAESSYKSAPVQAGSSRIATSSPAEGSAQQAPSQTELTRFYRSGYASGFAHALQMAEHLLARGLSVELVLKSLNEMLAEDIKPTPDRD